MRLFLTIACIFISQSGVVISAPIIQKIVNNTDFAFLVVYHDDNTQCSLQNKNIIIAPRTSFTQDFLIELGTKGLILKPVYYQNADDTIFWLTNSVSYSYQDQLVNDAFDAWYPTHKYLKKHKISENNWIQKWIGGNIAIIFDSVEMVGYLLNLSRIKIENNNFIYTHWLSFAKGIFSKLIIELELFQDRYKGIASKISMKHGQGGICNSGTVERI